MRWVTTKNSKFEVIQYNGKYLSSFYDPVREANNWMRNLDKYILKKENLVLIGCGSGYQIDQLDRLNIFKRIYVFSLSEKQKKMLIEKFKYSNSVRFISEKEWCDQNISNSYAVAEISSDKIIDMEKFQLLKNLISQRNIKNAESHSDFIIHTQPKSPELLSVKHISYKKSKAIDLIVQELVK